MPRLKKKENEQGIGEEVLLLVGGGNYIVD